MRQVLLILQKMFDHFLAMIHQFLFRNFKSFGESKYFNYSTY